MFHVKHSITPYFPMQNLLNILPRMSSVVTSPVISPRESRAALSSMARNSGESPFFSRLRKDIESVRGLFEGEFMPELGQNDLAAVRMGIPAGEQPPDCILQLFCPGTQLGRGMNDSVPMDDRG